MGERTEECVGREDGRFERAAEQFRHAGELFARAADRFDRADGRSEQEKRIDRADGRSERNERTDRAEERSGQAIGFERTDRRSERTEDRDRDVRMDLLAREMDRLSSRLERAKISEYVDLLNRPLSLIWRNFVGGMARGIGIAIGFTFFAATILYVLQMLGKLNLPIIGDYIADIVRIVQRQLEGRTY